MDKETVLKHLRIHIEAAKERGKMTPEELQRRGIPSHRHAPILAQAEEARQEARALQTAHDHVARTYLDEGELAGLEKVPVGAASRPFVPETDAGPADGPRGPNVSEPESPAPAEPEAPQKASGKGKGKKAR